MDIGGAKSLGEQVDQAEAKQRRRQQYQQAVAVQTGEGLVELGPGDNDAGNKVEFRNLADEKTLLRVVVAVFLERGALVLRLTAELADMGDQLPLIEVAEGGGQWRPENPRGIEEEGLDALVFRELNH